MSGSRPALALLAALAAVALAAPLIAGEAPLLVRTTGGIASPALARAVAPLPAIGGGGTAGWSAPAGEEILWMLRPPVRFDPLAIDLHERLQPPGARHWLGTDELGRDVLSRLLHGARPSLLVALMATAVSLLLGVPVGATAGYAGGRVDLILSRAIEASLSFPALILLLLIAALTLERPAAPGADVALRSMLIVGASVGLARWGVIARYMRAECRRQRGGELEMAARSGGATPLRILVRHLVPAGFQPVAVSAAFGAGSAVIAEASLSFLGLGVQPPAPTWGQMIASSAALGTRSWWMLIFPGIMVAATVASFHLVGDALRRRRA